MTRPTSARLALAPLLLFAAITAFVQPGDEVVIQTPAYDLYAPAVALAGGRLIEVPLLGVDGAWNVDALIGAIHDRTRLVILNTRTTPRAQASRLPRRVGRSPGSKPTLVLSDEVYGPIVHDGGPSVPAAHPVRENVGSPLQLRQAAPGDRLEDRLGRGTPPDAELRKHQYDVFSTGAPSRPPSASADR